MLVHTRQIVDPSVGAKLTGKVGSFNVGYLGAVDESPTSLFGGDDKAVFNLVRIRRDIGTGSTAGLLYTDRTMTGDGGYNRVLSGDARILLSRNYTLTTQFAGSWTGDGVTSGDTFRPLVMAQLARSGRTFGWQVKFDDVHPNFNTRSGFIPRVGDTQVFGTMRKTHFGQPGSTLERISASLQFDSFFDHTEFWSGGTPFEYEVEFRPTFSFKGGRSITLVVRDGFFRFRPEDYGNYEILDGAGLPAPFVTPDDLDHMLAVAVTSSSRITNQIQVNANLFYREVPLFSEGARGLEFQFRPDVTLRPTTSLQVQLTHTYSRLQRQRDHTEFSTVNISRVRTRRIRRASKE